MKSNLNKFEHVWGSQGYGGPCMGGGGAGEVPSKGVGGGAGPGCPCLVRFNAFWVLVTWDPLWTDRLT